MQVEINNYYNQKEIWTNDLNEDQRDILSAVLNILPKDINTVLDVGCGKGIITNALPDSLDVTGIDTSVEALSYVKAKTIVGDIRKLPFEDKSFDLVLCTDTLEHFPTEDLINVISEIKRVATKYILIAVPYKEDLEYSKAKCQCCGKVYHINWHFQSFDTEYLNSCFQSQPEAWFNYRYTFTGSKWPYYDNSLLQLKHKLDCGWIYWDKAICPDCGERLKSDTKENDSELFFNNINDWNYSNDFFGNSISIPKREIIALYKTDKSVSQVSEHEINDSISGEVNIYDSADLAQTNMDLYMQDLREINPYVPQCIGQHIIYYVDRSYIIKNEFMDWGDIQEVDNKKVLVYLNNNGQFCHAPFIIMNSREAFRIEIEYKDNTDEEVYVEVFDYGTSKYIRVGSLEYKNDNLWKKCNFAIDSIIEPNASGYLFRLISNSAHPVYQHLISCIRVISDRYDKVESSIIKIDKNKFKFNIRMDKDIQIYKYIFFLTKICGIIENVKIDQFPALILYPRQGENYLEIPRSIYCDKIYNKTDGRGAIDKLMDYVIDIRNGNVEKGHLIERLMNNTDERFENAIRNKDLECNKIIEEKTKEYNKTIESMEKQYSTTIENRRIEYEKLLYQKVEEINKLNRKIQSGLEYLQAVDLNKKPESKVKRFIEVLNNKKNIEMLNLEAKISKCIDILKN